MSSTLLPWTILAEPADPSPGLAGEQAPLPKEAKAKKKNKWKWKWAAEIEATYDSNVYKFSDDQIDQFENPSTGDLSNGRYDDMESDDDFILHPSVTLELETKGFKGEPLTFSITPQYEYFIENTDKSHPQAKLEIMQDLPHGRAIGLFGQYAHDVFAKNYFADTSVPSGPVSRSERIYENGIHRDWDAGVEYEERLWKRKKSSGWWLGMDKIIAQLNLGYGQRSYDSPLSNRDFDSYSAGLAFEFEYEDLLDILVGYDFRYVDSVAGREVMLRDEADFGEDFDGNGNTTGSNVRTEQVADRTRLEHSLGARLQLHLSKHWVAKVAYQIRLQDYTSDERYDLSNNGREDWRHRVRGGLEWEFAKKWWLELEGQWINENVERLSTPSESEDREYTKHIASISLKHRF